MKTIITFAVLLCGITLIAGFSACTKEDLSGCVATYSLRVNVVDDNGVPVTQTNEVGSVRLCFFNHKSILTYTSIISPYSLLHGESRIVQMPAYNNFSVLVYAPSKSAVDMPLGTKRDVAVNRLNDVGIYTCAITEFQPGNAELTIILKKSFFNTL